MFFVFFFTDTTTTEIYTLSLHDALPISYGVVAGSFTGNGSGITNLTGSNIVSGIPSAVLPSTVAYLSANQLWTAPQTYGSSITVNNAASLGAANQAVTISSNLVVGYALLGSNGSGASNQILASQGPGSAPQWINQGIANALLSSTNTWTATQMYVSSIAVSAPGGVGVTYGVVAGSLRANDLSVSQFVKTDASRKLISQNKIHRSADG